MMGVSHHQPHEVATAYAASPAKGRTHVTRRCQRVVTSKSRPKLSRRGSARRESASWLMAILPDPPGLGGGTRNNRAHPLWSWGTVAFFVRELRARALFR